MGHTGNHFDRRKVGLDGSHHLLAQKVSDRWIAEGHPVIGVNGRFPSRRPGKGIFGAELNGFNLQ
jgi:hypothetical protein